MMSCMERQNLAVVISSCDYYCDCWKPMAYSVNKHWGDCPFPIYLITNFKKPNLPGISIINVGEDKAWGNNLHRVLEQVPVQYILLLQEDYFLTSKVDTSAIEKHVEYCIKEDIDYLRLDIPFRDNLTTSNPRYCLDPISKEYALCLQTAIWRRSTLLDLTKKDWTGWEYERNIHRYIRQNHISIKSRVLNSRYYPQESLPITDGTAIRKGLWTIAGRNFLIDNGFAELVATRKVESLFLHKLMVWHNIPLLRYPTGIMIRTIQKFLKRR